MEVKSLGNSRWSLRSLKEKSYFTLEVTLKRREVKFHLEPFNLRESFTYGRFIDIDKRFRGYDDVKSIYPCIKETLDQGNVEIRNVGGCIFVLWLYIFGSYISITFKEKEEVKQINQLTYELKALRTENDELRSKIEQISPTEKVLLQLSQLNKSQTIREPKNFIKCICVVNETKFASSSSNKNINVYNSSTFKKIYTLKGHTSDVNYMSRFGKESLISCGRDALIIIWKIGYYNGVIRDVIRGNYYSLLKVTFIRSKMALVACSENPNIQIFTLKDKKFSMTSYLVGHTKKVSSIVKSNDEKFLVSAGADEFVYIRETQNYFCLKKFTKIPCDWSQSLLEKNGKIFVCGNNKVTIINLTSLQLETQVTCGNVKWIDSILPLNDNLALCGCYTDCGKGSFMLLDIEKFQILSFKYFAHEKDVKSLLLLNDGTIVSGSWDGIIKVWKK